MNRFSLKEDHELLGLVSKYPYLYDKNHIRKVLFTQHMEDEVWTQIASSFRAEITGDDCRIRWHMLCRKYELNKRQNNFVRLYLRPQLEKENEK